MSKRVCHGTSTNKVKLEGRKEIKFLHFWWFSREIWDKNFWAKSSGVGINNRLSKGKWSEKLKNIHRKMSKNHVPYVEPSSPFCHR